MHWLDQKALWKECKRVLKPEGSVAVWGYSLPHIVGNESASEIIRNYHKMLWDGGFWEKERKFVDDHFAGLNLESVSKENGFVTNTW